jgi:hypothetical protein
LNGASVKISFLVAVVILGAVGCGREAAVARHTVAGYRADKPLREEVFWRCANDPGTLGTTPDCVNAREAERLESYGSLRDSGPIGLDSKKKP